MQGEDYYAADTVFPFEASLSEISIGFETNFDLFQRSVQYFDIVNKLLVDRREVR